MASEKQKSTNREWVSKRVDHLMRKNPDMGKAEAYQVAWNQCYASGKCKGERPTKSHKSQKKHYKKSPSEYEQNADPKRKKKSEVWNALIVLANQLDESGFEKLADRVTDLLKIALKK
jgi:hypothetical protein